MSYESAFQELRGIVEELKRGEIDIDSLAEKVKRVTFLCQFLRERLRKTEQEVQVIFQETEKKKLE
ncbi:MAG: exodeoxyribonuclease VII small subunit [Candidatus Caldatribacteriaceae bacterium]